MSDGPYAVIDFETWGIGPRPRRYPPEPCGVAIQIGRTRQYYAWAHALDNSCTREDARNELLKVWSTHDLVFHNCAFDIEVAMKHLDLPWPARFHDTLVLAYLYDPRARSMSLKPLADLHLDMRPTEQEELRDWILENVEGATKKNWGGFIQAAPGSLAGKYARGDVDRTWKLFKKFMHYAEHPFGEDHPQNMLQAYRNELELLKVKISMEQGGIRADTARLQRDVPKFQACLDDVATAVKGKMNLDDGWVEENCPKGVFNPNSGPQLAAALEHAGLVSEEDWVYTDKGKKSTARKNLEGIVKDPELVELLSLQGILTTYTGTFLGPWLQACEANNGYIYPSFNTVRNSDEYGNGAGYGTGTGRLSSSNPNFQNIPASVDGSAHEAILRKLAAWLREFQVELIGLRDYLIPDEGCVFLNRDYAQQELRILAHYEDAELLARYREQPDIDSHTLVQTIIKEATGVEYARRPIKNTNFGIIYGMGKDKLAAAIGCPVEEASALKKTILEQIPGIGNLIKELKRFARRDLPLTTYGGRIYYCEEDKLVDGNWRSYDYKMLNTLIQGSAADCTKQAMRQVFARLSYGRIVLQVHDELMLCAPIEHARLAMEEMRDAMEDMQFDVPMLTDGKWGLEGQSWARLTGADI